MAQTTFTDPVLYTAFSHSPYQTALQVTDVYFGECTSQSKADKRKDAWRCQANGQTFDPCFQHPFVNRNQLICPLSPWQSAAVKITTHQELDDSQHAELDMSRNNPWAMELKDGTRCIINTSTDSSSHKYHCGDQDYLVGNIYRCKGSWEIYRKSGESFEVAEVKRAWF